MRRYKLSAFSNSSSSLFSLFLTWYCVSCSTWCDSCGFWLTLKSCFVAAPEAAAALGTVASFAVAAERSSPLLHSSVVVVVAVAVVAANKGSSLLR